MQLQLQNLPHFFFPMRVVCCLFGFANKRSFVIRTGRLVKATCSYLSGKEKLPL
jgi:hypothetical protein